MTSAPVGAAPKAAVPVWAARLCCLAAALIWGSSFFIMKDTLDALPPFYLLAVRFSAAALVLMAALWRRVSACLKPDVVVCGLILGALVFGGYGAQTVGLTDTTPGNNAFLTGTYCVMVPFMAWAVTRVRPQAKNVVAAVLCVGGIGLVSLSGDLSIRFGDALTLVGAVFFGVHIVATGCFSNGRDVLALTAWQMVGVAALSWVATFVAGEDLASAVWTPGVVGSMAYLALACTCVAYLLQNIGTKYADPSSVALLLSMESPSGVLFSVLFAGEVLTAQVLCGFALIFVAILVSELDWPFVRRRGGEGRESLKPAE